MTGPFVLVARLAELDTHKALLLHPHTAKLSGRNIFRFISVASAMLSTSVRITKDLCS